MDLILALSVAVTYVAVLEIISSDWFWDKMVIWYDKTHPEET